MMNILTDLNDEQKQAITFGEGPLLIVAGAGTGKTTVITRRLAWLIDQNLAKPEEILALTFTDKAAEEMEERVDRLLPYGYLDLWISTFHSFGDRILRQHGLDIGLPNDFKVLTPTEAWLLVRQNLEKFDLDYYRPLGNPTKFIHALIKHFSRCKDEEISPADYLKYAEGLKLNSDTADLPTRKNTNNNTNKHQAVETVEINRLTEIANGYHVYNQLLLDNGALDFGDLINYTLKLFQTRLKILEKYRQQFKYILIDEFQDTNLAQYELIKLLAAPKNNLTVVGDDDQSIYKFRGASISNILHFKKDFPQAKEAVIAQNFRSRQNMLDLAYKLIKNNDPERLETKLNINKKLQAAKEGPGIIEHLHARTAEEEARQVAEKILEIYNNSWNDFAILVRANAHAEMFMHALDRAGLPYQFLASTGLYREPLVMDILAYLRLLDNYHENTAVFRILNLPLWQLAADDLIRLNHFAKKKTWSLYETLKQAPTLSLKPESLKIINQILSLVEKHTALAREQSVGKIILTFLTDSGYLRNLTEREKQGEILAIKQILYLKKFFDTITQFEKSHTENKIKHYLEELNYILESGEEGSLSGTLEEGPETIKIMTVHSAKGLQFRYVFIVNLVDLKFPSTDRKDPIEIPEALVKEIIPQGDIHLQEERRLFYVAITRAKEGVFLTSADDYGGTRKRKSSRFLYEIGMEKVKDIKEIGKTKPSQYPISNIQYPAASTPKTGLILELPKHFSYTQLKAFETCPFQYKFAHLLQIPVRGRANFSFGKTLHLTLQKFYERIIDFNSAQQNGLFDNLKTLSNSVVETIKAPSLDEFLAIYESSWIDDWYKDKKQKKEYYEKGKEILRKFYELNQDNWTIPQSLENGFHLKIGEYIFRGNIDRLDVLPDNTVEVIDYKTGRPKTEEKISLEDKEQLLIYQMAVEEAWRQKPSRLSFYYLDNNQKISFLGTAEEIQKTKDKIIATIKEMKTSDFPPKPSEHHCQYCDFKDICEYATNR